MNMAKSYKFLLLIATFFISLILAICSLNFGVVKAETTLVPTNYFSGSNQGMKYYDDNVVVSVKQDDTFVISRELVIDDLRIVLDVPTEITELIVKLTVKSFDVNGNMRQDGEEVYFDKNIELEYALAGSGEINLDFGVNEDNYVVINGNVLNEGNPYYKVKHVDKTPAKIQFVAAAVSGDQAVDLSLISVDQKRSDISGKYKQTFELNADGNALNTRAYPRAVIAENFFTATENGYVLNKIGGTGYTATISSYSVTNMTPSGNMFLSAQDTAEYLGANGYSIYVPTSTAANKTATFYLKPGAYSSEMKFNISADVSGEEIIVEEYPVTVYGEDYQNTAPSYRDPATVASEIESFKTALYNATKTEGKNHSINLGSKITIPSLENFVIDDMTAYKDMSIVYHYVTPSNQEKTSTSTKSIALDEAGEYKLYVTFTDKHGDSMDAKDFFEINDDQTITEGKYYPYVFSFTINDDAPLSIETIDQDDGYIGVRYYAAGFDIVASGYSEEYTLWYNANKNAAPDSNGWVQIIGYKDAGSDGANGYSYEQLKSIDYNGKLTFTPDREGLYKIDCKIVSDKSYRYVEDSILIRIENEPITVSPANYWLRDNYLSVIFLGVGTLCLIGIVVLLFVKPKDADED
ncbi:MAG: hypothetical protein II988_03020 [Clostridia bacterium]|nr:hypothetical protein [Clostridia bacterium]